MSRPAGNGRTIARVLTHLAFWALASSTAARLALEAMEALDARIRCEAVSWRNSPLKEVHAQVRPSRAVDDLRPGRPDVVLPAVTTLS
jgi:hypothetical protein